MTTEETRSDAVAVIPTSGGPGPQAGKIGPNAITRIAEALETVEGGPSVRRIFQAAGLDAYLTAPPIDMVDEREVMRLHAALRDHLGPAQARMVGGIAGRLTADYLLRHRIPRPAQIALRCCPPSLASRLLGRAIARNAWTFVGSGAFSARHGQPTIFTIRNCPVCRGQCESARCCDFYAATFERLYRRLVTPGASVREIACQARGEDACAFAIEW